MMASCSCEGKIIIDMNTILNSNGNPEREFFGTDADECIYGTINLNRIYGYGGDVSFSNDEYYAFVACDST